MPPYDKQATIRRNVDGFAVKKKRSLLFSVRVQLLSAVALILVVLTVRSRRAFVCVLHVRGVVRGGDWFCVLVWHCCALLFVKWFDNYTFLCMCFL